MWLTCDTRRPANEIFSSFLSQAANCFLNSTIFFRRSMLSKFAGVSCSCDRLQSKLSLESLQSGQFGVWAKLYLHSSRWLAVYPFYVMEMGAMWVSFSVFLLLLFLLGWLVVTNCPLSVIVHPSTVADDQRKTPCGLQGAWKIKMTCKTQLAWLLCSNPY